MYEAAERLIVILPSNRDKFRTKRVIINKMIDEWRDLEAALLTTDSKYSRWEFCFDKHNQGDDTRVFELRADPRIKVTLHRYE